MTALVLNGDTSGSVTLQVPAAAGAGTVHTLPAASGTVMVSGNQPLFYAGSSAATSVSSSTYVKMNFALEYYDTNNCYDPSTSTFTPNVAGYYQVNAAMQYNGPSTTTGFVFPALTKNGSIFLTGALITAIQYAIPVFSGLVYCNGTTDYLELYAYQSQGSTQTISGQWFQAVLVRAA